MSLALLVRVAVPAIVALGLSAAYLIFRSKSSAQQESQEGERRSNNGRSSPQGMTRARPPGSTEPRQRRRPVRIQEEEECTICMEQRALVELYPCRHRSMCEGCVVQIISRNKRACPFCRRRIQGYGDPVTARE